VIGRGACFSHFLDAISTTASAARSRRGDLRSRIIPIGCAAARG